MALMSCSEACSFQMTTARAEFTLPTQLDLRAASSIFWIFAALHGPEGKKEADRASASQDFL